MALLVHIAVKYKYAETCFLTNTFVSQTEENGGESIFLG